MIIALFLCAMILAGGAISFRAQFSVKDNFAAEKKSAGKALSEIIRKKLETSPFVLLTPTDLSKISDNALETMLVGENPCETAAPISFGQTVNGQLSSTDCRLDDNSYADFYYFNGTQGQQVTVAMNSTAFDTYLGLANETGTFVVEDDDGGGGTNSRIVATLPQTGLYIILANSVFANQFGNYSVSLNGSTVCTYSLEPTGAQVPAAGGNFTFTVNTQPGCYWSASTDVYLFLRTSSAGMGTGIVEYSVNPNDGTTVRTEIIRVSGQIFTVTQPPLVCNYSINPTSAAVPADGVTGSFTITAPDGCYWRASSPDYFIWTTNEGRGTTAITYTVSPNNGADRAGKIVVNNLEFTITQPGRNCTYSVSPTSISANQSDQRGTLFVTTQPGCTWSASAGYSWITLDNLSGIGSGTISYRLYANPYFAPRTHVVVVYGNGVTTMRVTFTQAAFVFKRCFDYDGDGRADISVFRPSVGAWYLQQSSNNSFFGFSFGADSDIVTPADFDGDGKTDIAVFRPNNGGWYWLNSSNSSFSAAAFGTNGDLPVPADYDGDGKADIAVFRPSNGVWYLLRSSQGFTGVQFGQNGDKPMTADYDGDGKGDIAVVRQANGVSNWYILGSSQGFYGVQFGTDTDKLVPADYDGDGKADIAVYRSGVWYLLQSQLGFTGVSFGTAEDKPVPADYDGDGKADIAVFRPSNGVWYLLQSTAGFAAVSFGIAEDNPTPNAFVR